MRALLASALLAVITASPSTAQVRPQSQWALGLGVSVLGTGSSYGGSGTGFGIAGSYSRMFNHKLGFEAEGRMSSGTGSEAIPGCVEGATCSSTTIIPSSVVGADLRMLYRPIPQVRLSAGPVLAYAPGVLGPNSGMVGGIGGGFGVFPFSADGSGVGLEMRGSRFFSPLGEVEWAVGTGLSFRF
jgi:hypothetical protein